MKFTLSLLLLMLLPVTVLAGDYEDLPEIPAGVRAPQDSVFDIPLKRGMQLVYQDKYAEALALFDSLARVHPNHPAPYFYRAAVLQGWMSSYRFNNYQDQLEDNIQKALDIGNARLEKKKGDPWLHFYVGGAYGYRAFYRFRRFNWIGAYLDGRKGVGNFEDALKKEPTLYDVYLGLGSYHYWRTARSSFIKVVAFWMRDRRDLGIEQIKFSIDHGQYTPDEATMGVIIALYDYEKYGEALKLLQEWLQPPQMPVISAVYLRGRLLAKFNRWEGVRRDFQDVLNRLSDSPFHSIGYEVECKYWIAQSLKEEGRLDEARRLASEAMALSETRDADKELEGPLDGFDDIKDRLKKLVDELK